MKDRFTKASEELSDRNPYICDSCTTTFGHETVGPIGDQRLRDREHPLHTDVSSCLLNCDPIPFGD